MGLFSSLVDGIFGNKRDKANNKAAAQLSAADKAYNDKIRAQDRGFYLSDTADERSYLEGLTASDRAHALSMLSDDRRYFESTRSDERAYAADLLRDDRDYAAGLTASDRAYAASVTAGDRAYMDRRRLEDRSAYMADRDLMQSRADTLAEKTAASRGIDFQKLRDDAVSAGFNPMTALSMAHAYSRHVDYGAIGGPWDGGANYNASTTSAGASHAAGSSGGGGGGGMPSGGVVGSHVPAGGSFSSAGSGYQSHFSPAMSSGSFISEAVGRAEDTLFNRPEPGGDKLADALKNAHALAEAQDQAEMGQFSRNFGYSLTNVEPFRPAATAGVPALASGSTSLSGAPTIGNSVEIGGKKFVPVQTPDGKFRNIDASIARRLDIKPFDTLSPGDETELLGEVAEIQSAANQPGIRRNVYKGPGIFRKVIEKGPSIGSSLRDYFERGTTGNVQFPRGQHFNPWADF